MYGHERTWGQYMNVGAHYTLVWSYRLNDKHSSPVTPYMNVGAHYPLVEL